VTPPRTIGVVTVGRSDYGYFRPILKLIAQEPSLRAHLIVSGMHLSQRFGYTIREIEQDGWSIGDRFEMSTEAGGDTPADIAKSIGAGVSGFAASYQRTRPDILLLLGDRFETFAAAAAAVPFAIPIAHLHGGETTEGAIDEAFRHAITKMSHLHFVATETYRDRVVQMGEAPWRVTVSGAPALDNLASVPRLSRDDLEKRYGIRIADGTLLATYHPVTLEIADIERHTDELFAALRGAGRPVIFTYPNADTRGSVIISAIERYVREMPGKAQAVKSLGVDGYFNLLGVVSAMVGNSSSGIIEAASFKLPVVDVGNRQRGRVRPANVIHTEDNRAAIGAAIERAISAEFRRSLAALVNPYGDGQAAPRIVKRLRDVSLDQKLIRKSFHDITTSGS
jgi:UDP-hydrolysing UDP-N-acetyl-D-glucosamine 2-epimerase